MKQALFLGRVPYFVLSVRLRRDVMLVSIEAKVVYFLYIFLFSDSTKVLLYLHIKLKVIGIKKQNIYTNQNK